MLPKKQTKNNRFKYLKHSHQHPHKHPDCKFCKNIKAKRNILLENDHIVVMFGRQHQKGHLLVMPKAHEEDLMREAIVRDLARTVLKQISAL